MKILAALPLALLILAGCSSGPSVVGTWKMSGGQMNTAGATATVTFSAPDKMSTKMNLNNSGMEIAMDATGTYKLEGDQLTMKVEDVDVDLSKLPEQVRKMAESQMNKESMLKQMNSTPTGTIKWEGADKFTVTSGGQTVTMDRQK